MSLEFAAAQFLKWEKRCPLVLMERSPRTWHAGQPDVIGITESRYMLEVEVKRTVSDFRANMKKRHLQNRFCLEESIRSTYAKAAPKQFWFMVPPTLVDKVMDDLPDWAGLLIPHENQQTAIVVKPSPSNNESERLSLKECAKLMRNAGNFIIALMRENSYRRFQENSTMDSTAMDDFHFPGWDNKRDYVNFQI